MELIGEHSLKGIMISITVAESISQLPIKKWGSGDSTFDRKVRLLSLETMMSSLTNKASIVKERIV